MRNYLKLIKLTKGKNHHLYIGIIFALFASICMLVAPLYLRTILNNILVHDVKIDLYIVLSLYILGGILTWLSSVFATKYAVYTMEFLRDKLTEKVFNVPIGFLDKTPFGSIINNYTTDVEIIYDGTSHLFSQAFMSIFMMVGSLGLMIYLNVYLAIMVTVLSLLILFVTKKLNKLSEKHYFNLQKNNAELNGLTNEFISEHKLIYSYNYEEIALKRFEEKATELKDSSKRANVISALSNPTTRFINNIIFILIGFIVGYVFTDNFEIGLLTSFIAYSQSFSKPINDLTNLSSILMASTKCMDRVFDLLDEKNEIDLHEFDKEDIFKKGNISINHLYFAYDKRYPLIEDLSLEIKRGDKIAIVGPTGAGKSTLINLLLRFYDAREGNIMIDNKNIDHVSKRALRESIGLVLQEPWLFEGTIYENITYGKEDATMEDVIYASKLAGADEFIQTLKDGYQAKVLEDGRNLSIGQRQLITIARALILDSTILILDEATSNVDRLMERELQKTFKHIIKNKTSFFIAHRLSNVVDSTAIIVMDKGKIVEIGNHEALMNKKGFYYNLFQSQFTV
ncbi:ABC transporter ATP-binding protein [Acholeplasma hippikon]|uniref:ABC-type multidrug/protein/lipid transport system ATPase component n=1 Tax=Acholeplasma hippikon TaxID=264636 RepID=A0A449BIJ1_9MOLU|nr:ABC transporter ATP-binding protein [Acholeplasma hippikon]VEU82223.1 ABC-type multidrug/protein/lipid transport system ATPase component [Acholeplasma hippikon]